MTGAKTKPHFTGDGKTIVYLHSDRRKLPEELHKLARKEISKSNYEIVETVLDGNSLLEVQGLRVLTIDAARQTILRPLSNWNNWKKLH